MSRANLVLKLRFDVEPAKVSRFDNPVIWWCVLPKTIMNSWTSKYHWSKLQSVEVRWLSTMSFSDDGKVVKVQPGTKIGTEFSNFTRRNMRDVPLRIKLLVEMLRLVVIPDYTADSTAQVCLKHSAGCGKLLCSKHFSTLIYLWESSDFSLPGVHWFPRGDQGPFFFGAQIPPAKPCLKLKWEWRNVEKIPSLEGWTSTYCISYFDLFWCFPLDGVTHQPQTPLAGRGCKDHLRVRTSGCQDGWQQNSHGGHYPNQKCLQALKHTGTLGSEHICTNHGNPYWCPISGTSNITCGWRWFHW